jgi:hypothetical protein
LRPFATGGFSTPWKNRPGFSTQWKTFLRVFHTMEYIFHRVENLGLRSADGGAGRTGG